MPYASINNIRIHYLDNKSDKPPIVFLHGFTLDHRSWDTQSDFFGKDYRVIIPDSRGHGLSDSPITGYSRDDRIADLIALLDYLKLDKVHLVGLSMGGSTAIGLATSHQERLLSLTLVDSGAAGYSPGPKISRIDKVVRERGLEAGRELWVKAANMWYKDDQKDIKELLQTMMREHSGATWLDERRGKYPTRNDLDFVFAITVSTMIFVGALDKIFVPLARELHARIKGSHLAEFEGVGHMLNLEAPKRFNEELKLFLEQV